MAQEIGRKRPVRQPPEGFDVTISSTIGRVNYSDVGDGNPMEVAFKLIGTYVSEQHVIAGEFAFPGPDENQTINVTVGLTER